MSTALSNVLFGADIARNQIDHLMVDLNLVVRFWLDPVSSLFLGSPRPFLAYQLLVFTIGLFLIFRRQFERYSQQLSTLHAALLSLILSMTAFALTPSPSWLYRFELLPLYVHCLCGTKLSHRLWAIVLAFLIVFSAGPLAPFLCALAVAVSYGVAVSNPLPAISRVFAPAMVVVATLLCPIYTMPDYPGGARLTSITSWNFISSSLFGATLYPETVLRSGYVALLSHQFTVLLIAAVIFLVTIAIDRIRVGAGRGATSFQLRLGAVLLIAAFCVILPEILTPGWKSLEDAIGAATPFWTLRRLLPGMALFPAAWFVAAQFFVAALIVGCRIRHTGLLVSLLIAILTLGYVMPIRHQVESAMPWELAADSASIDISPSRFVLESIGTWASKPVRVDFDRPLEVGPMELHSSFRPEDLSKMIDGDRETRWGAPQRDRPQFEVRFSFPQPVRAMTLFPGQAGTDFPKGIRVERLEAREEGAEWIKVVDQTHWLGVLRWSPKGYPYLGSQTEVTLYLPDDAPALGFRISQIGKEDYFDWSVYDLRFYPERSDE